MFPKTPSVRPIPALPGRENSTFDHEFDTTLLPYDRTLPYPWVNSVYQWKCVAFNSGSLNEFSRVNTYSA